MRKIQILLFLALLAYQSAQAQDNFFSRKNPAKSERPRIFTITPSQIPAYRVTELLVQGENLLPHNNWDFDGVRILKEKWIDSRTIMLTVYAHGSSGLRGVSVGQSQPVTIELMPAELVLSDDFDDGDLNGWIPEKGNWTVNSGQAAISAQRVARLFPAISDTDNVTIDFDLTLASGKQAGLYFHYRDSQNFRLLAIDGTKRIIRLRDRFGGFYETKKKFPLQNPNNTHHFTITISNNRVTVAVDSVPLIDENLVYSYSGKVVLYAKAATARFDNVVIDHDPAANAVPLVNFTHSAVQENVSVNAAGSIDPDGNIVAYSWNFGDGATADGMSAQHDYSRNGKFNITLTITDNSGAKTKVMKTVNVNSVVSEADAIKEVVKRFFELLDDVEHLTGPQICVDFSRNSACTAYQKQVDDIEDVRDTIRWFEVEFLSDVSIQFRSATEAYPVRVRNLLRAMYDGDPQLYTTDGWHTYNMRKEADGKWHQCSYVFQEIN